MKHDQNTDSRNFLSLESPTFPEPFGNQYLYQFNYNMSLIALL